MVGPDFRVMYNGAFARLTGAGDLPSTDGQAAAPTVLGPLWEVLRPIVSEAATGCATSLEHVRVATGGSLDDVTANVSCTPIVADDATVEGVFCTFAETRARELEQLRESETGLRAAVDLIGLGRYQSDSRNQSIEWDPRLKAIWGLPASAAVDMGVFVSGIHPRGSRTRAGCARRLG